jgi:DNA processing protein
MTGRDALIYLSLKYAGDWEKMVNGVRTHEDFEKEEAERRLQEVKSLVCTILDPQYPPCFKNCFRPPLVFYYHGNLGLIAEEKKCLAYIGSREASPYGLKMAREIAGGLAEKGYVIVSGLARGIDGEATKAALEAHGKAVGILGNGIEVAYPSCNEGLYGKLKRDGLLLSEYPLLTPPDKSHFPQRNRLVAACAQSLIVGEASKKSGTLITVGYALGYNKEIGCVPYPADKDSACNTLIKEGAFMIENVADALLMMGDPAGEKEEK